MNHNFTLIRSSRKTLGLQITPAGELIVRAPNRLPLREIDRFGEEKQDWIQMTIQKVRTAKQAGEASPLRDGDIRVLADRARREIPPRVFRAAQAMGVTYGRITIRNQTGRWGSCSSTGNLNFNCLLMLAPESVLNYVVVHELCHRKHMDHSPAFWQEVARVLPDYKKEEAWLKREGRVLLMRMKSGREE